MTAVLGALLWYVWLAELMAFHVGFSCSSACLLIQGVMSSVLSAWGVTVRPCSHLMRVDYDLSGACLRPVKCRVCCIPEAGCLS